MKLLVFAGSTRAGSYNKQLAQEAAQVARDMGAQVTYIDLKDYPMPFYDGDAEAKQGMPKNAKRFRDALMANEGAVIAAAEYNGSISAVLKNAIDWASRGEDGKASQEAFKGKKFALMSASPSRTGGARGLVHLRAILEDVGGDVVAKEVSISRAYEKGAINNAEVKRAIREELSEVIGPVAEEEES
jgi:NAD(P)H-dependent FMN reductase